MHLRIVGGGQSVGIYHPLLLDFNCQGLQATTTHEFEVLDKVRTQVLLNLVYTLLEDLLEI